jgi:tetratricopeptide (TPR) repeat protein
MVFLKYILAIAIFVTSCFGIANAETSEENLQRDFVYHLFRNKEYFSAITEADRHIFYYPDSKYIEDMKIVIADSYAKGGDEVVALQRYENFLNEYPHSSMVPSVYFRIGILYADNRDYASAIKYFENIISNERTTESLAIKTKEWILLCMLLMDSEKEVITSTIGNYNLSEIREIKDLTDEYYSMNFKSPKIAGTLSAIVPGAGQLYLNRKRDATAAFILNGLFIWGIIEAIENDESAVAAILGVFEVGWYGGNIYSAVNGAHKHNRKLKDSFRRRFSIGLNLMVKNNYETIPTFNISYNF